MTARKRKQATKLPGKRKAIQIIAFPHGEQFYNSELYALANDGTIWHKPIKGFGEWRLEPNLPEGVISD